jgi:hypothetical protein
MPRSISSASSTDSGSCTRTGTASCGSQWPSHQRQVQGAAGFVAVGVGHELAVHGAQRARGHGLDQRFGACCGDRSGRRWCRSSGRAGRRTRCRSGRRAMVPSSFMISQITAAGEQPAMPARSHPASVWPARISTPPSAACSGKMWPGCTRSWAACARGHGGLHGAGAVGGRDAGGHALGRLDGDGEGGAHLGAVARHHGRQAAGARSARA